MIRRGTIVSYAAGNHTAVVAFASSTQTDLTVEVAANIDGADVTPGRGCYVVFDDAADVATAILIAVWDP